jgi:hypothetical protein
VVPDEDVSEASIFEGADAQSLQEPFKERVLNRCGYLTINATGSITFQVKERRAGAQLSMQGWLFGVKSAVTTVSPL